jgi:hypothetical protein
MSTVRKTDGAKSRIRDWMNHHRHAVENERFLEKSSSQTIDMALRHRESLHDITIAVPNICFAATTNETWPHMEWITDLWHQLWRSSQSKMEKIGIR